MNAGWAENVESQATLVGVSAKYPLNALETSTGCDISARSLCGKQNMRS